MTRRLMAACVVVVVSGLTACGGSDMGGPASCTPASTASLTITGTGLSPTNVCVLPGGTVTFKNTDTAAHDIVFDTANCPAVGNVAAAGQVATVFPTAENCSFHDAANASSSAYRGTVAVTSGTVSGGGY